MLAPGGAQPKAQRATPRLADMRSIGWTSFELDLWPLLS